MKLDIVIMAAGKGTRMNSMLPKVLHSLAGRPMIQHVLETADQLNPDRIVIVTGYRNDLVYDFSDALPIKSTMIFTHQEPQLGTGHAVQTAVSSLHQDSVTLVLNGDVPLIKADTLSKLAGPASTAHLALLTVILEDPTGYGRIVRNAKGDVTGIVEEKDATPEQREIKEVYTGILGAPTPLLTWWVSRLTNDNAQKEYYLTDIVAQAVLDHVKIIAIHPASLTEVLGVNSPEQLKHLEDLYNLEHQMERA